MRTKIRRWGNSLGLRIPKALAEAAEVREGSSVELSVLEGEIVVRPATQRYELAELLAEVRREHLHVEAATGAPRGREIW